MTLLFLWNRVKRLEALDQQFSMRRFCNRFLPALLLFALAFPPSPVAAQAPDTATGSDGMVVAAEPFAAEAGLEILKQGGNAVDAAVAVGFALAVTYPQAGNLGGGGFMLIRMADGRAALVDYREAAPGAAHRDMYLDAEGNLIPQASTVGWRAAGVPGAVAGLTLALEKFGTLPLKKVMAPAIRLAEKGFPVSKRLAHELRDAAPLLSQFPESRRIFLRNGRYYEPGETFRQKDLARTLKKIAKRGARAFYQGAIGKRFARAMKRHHGLITRADLRRYQARVRQPLVGHFRGYEILGAPPPSSGGVAVLEMLNILDPLLPPDAEPLAPQTIHLMTETMRRAFADRARFLGDADFASVPVRGLLDPDYARTLRASIDPARASASEQLSLPDPPGYEARSGNRSVLAPRRESANTTHFSVVDGTGNAVATSITINSFFGNGVTLPGLGFLLNNEMDDFTSKPGAPNALFGLVQSEANKIEPGKRPLSSMSPTIVTRDGEAILALGSPGGPRIINAVLLVLLNRLAFGRPLAEAVALPRYHHQWMPDTLFLEKNLFSQEQLDALAARGHALRERESIGTVNAIERDPATGRLTGVSDARRRGVARGF